MRRWHLTVVMAMAVAVAVLAMGCQQAASSVTELKAGIGTALSGSGAELGVMLGRTYQMAGEDIGEFEVAGKKYKWNTIVEDNLYTSAGGVQVTNKFISQDEAKFVYHLGSAPANAAQPVIEAAKIIYDASSSTPAILGPKFKYTFRAYLPPSDSYPGLIAYLKKNAPELKNWYILVADDASGTAIEASVKPIVQHFGLNLVGSSKYPRETTDFYPILVKVLPTKPDVIVTLSASAVGTMVKQAREQGYTGKFLGSAWPPKLDEIAGVKNAEGFMVPDADMWSDKTPKEFLEFGKRYEERYKEQWTSFGRNAWIPLYMVTGAMKRAGTVDDVDKIVKTLETEKIDTPLGPMYYGGASIYGVPHQLVWPVWISEFKDGKMRTIGTVPPDEVVSAAEAVFKK